MGKTKPLNPGRSTALSSLKMRLSNPGMSAIHRAGLGGLVCTLRYIERARMTGELEGEELPGWPWPEQKPPWVIDRDSVLLEFAEPKLAGVFLKRLFEIAFQIRDGLVYLPGQYPDVPPPFEVRAELQYALLKLTFLQHGQTRRLESNVSLYGYDPEGAGTMQLNVAFQRCNWYRHQDGWSDLVDDGHLTQGVVEVVGPLNPGAVVRHNAFSSSTKVEETVDTLLPLSFAPVGCLALPVNRGIGVLLIPDIDDLNTFANVRPLITPSAARECRVSSAGDAALQAQLRLRGKVFVRLAGMGGCLVATFMPTRWASQQKSRVATMYVSAAAEHTLDQFAMALAELPPRVRKHVVKETRGRGKHRQTTERTEFFWIESAVRALAADNLALGRPWYSGFARLMTAIDHNGNPIRDKLIYERKGLSAMTEKIPWTYDGEAAVVKAVHAALANRFAQIAKDNKENRVAMKNRWKGEYDRWRLAFAGAKTADQFRTAICDLFSRAKRNKVLCDEWTTVLPMLDAKRWQLTRDLALLALPSYPGKESDESREEATIDLEPKVESDTNNKE